jgi:hypothetical protein
MHFYANNFTTVSKDDVIWHAAISEYKLCKDFYFSVVQER